MCPFLILIGQDIAHDYNKILVIALGSTNYTKYFKVSHNT